jgi:hypothetical protein
MRQRYVMAVTKPATVEATVVVTAEDPESAKALARGRARGLPCDAWTIAAVAGDPASLTIVDTLPATEPPLLRTGSITPPEGVPLPTSFRRKTRR